MTYKLFIDDERFPITDDSRSSTEAIKVVEQNGFPVYISFDHDLGGTDTSRIFIYYLIDKLVEDPS